MTKEVNYLLGYENLKIVQDKEMFKCSLDSILLPNFITLKKTCKNILDIGTGNAPIPLILCTKTNAHIKAVEIQKEVYEMALESVHINKLEKQIEVINADINEFAKEYNDYFDYITCNPPYFKLSELSHINNNDYKTIARHEKTLTLEQIFKISRKVLKNNGFLGLVHRPERLVDILVLMHKYNIEPKKIQFVYPGNSKEASILLIEGAKNGKPGLKILEPIYAHLENGEYSDQIKTYFS